MTVAPDDPGTQERASADRPLSVASDPQAMAALVAQHLPALEGYVQQQAGAVLRRREDAADLVQSACREAIEAIADGRVRFQGEAAFRSWLFGAALRKVQQRARYHAAAQRSPSAEVPVSRAEELFLSLRTPSLSAEEHEERHRFSAAFARLGQAQQELIVWAHLDGLSHAQIAERVGTTVGNSRVLLARAVARLSRLASSS